MISKLRKFDLQLFADEEAESEQVSEGEQGEEVEGQEETEEEAEIRMSQEEFNRTIQSRLAREKKKMEKQLTQMFGTENLQEASQFYQIGQQLAKTSNKSPQEIMQRLQRQSGQQTTQSGQAVSDPQLYSELQELKQMITTREEQEQREKEEAEARKKFGRYFDQHWDAIQDKADEKGLTLEEAATLVLGPEMTKIKEEQQKNKKQVQRKRKLDSTDEKPADEGNPAAQLTEDEKRTAQKQGISYAKYLENKKALGRA